MLNVQTIIQSIRQQPLFGESTHQGAALKPNEDAHGVFSIVAGKQRCNLLVVADGVTSQAGSQRASQLAIDTVHQSVKAAIQTLPSLSPGDVRSLLKQAVLQADQEIKDVALHSDSGMSTTVVAALIVQNNLYVAHVGDSRAYLQRNQELYLLTRDHTFAEEMIQQGKLDREKAKQKTNRNVLTRYLGPGPIPDVDLGLIPIINTPENLSSVESIRLQLGDAVLLCSDGLTSRVSEDEISSILTESQPHLQHSADQLIKRALEKQETDNITAVLFRVQRKGAGLLSIRSLLVLSILLFALIMIIQLPTLLSSIQEPAPTEAAVVQRPTESTITAAPTITPPAPVTSTPDAPAQTATVTPFSAPSEALESKETQSSQSDATATVTRISISTSTPVPTITLSPLIETNTDDIATALPREETFGELPPSSNGITIPPELARISIQLESPADGDTIVSEYTFQWRPSVDEIPLGYAFEVIYWSDGQDPFKDGLGLAGAEITDVDNVRVNLVELENPIKAGTYLWGVLIVELDPYRRVRFLGKEHKFEFKPKSSSCPLGYLTDTNGCTPNES